MVQKDVIEKKFSDVSCRKGVGDGVLSCNLPQWPPTGFSQTIVGAEKVNGGPPGRTAYGECLCAEVLQKETWKAFSDAGRCHSKQRIGVLVGKSQARRTGTAKAPHVIILSGYH